MLLVIFAFASSKFEMGLQVEGKGRGVLENLSASKVFMHALVGYPKVYGITLSVMKWFFFVLALGTLRHHSVAVSSSPRCHDPHEAKEGGEHDAVQEALGIQVL